ncbi:DNA repair protein RecN [Flammeovirga kamogawensis]|uniref:DNA repair protein RecN n=1 Tax=Flammeovirga kamogawensis TaxID=373891 RepID=A0ABX8GUR7_9BACT|nr:DNA repair protein RecN [Flammeovirga kamogawensis]MBB6459588.1 DNA repair protein RecN (Recombination protein N) [Flammeovirga kamogawensis]QWG07348.1 DNA repair protein RecN [Flammeovirga kamogawensis]TRX69165.1 DNA repair protein RecN [Flammeovirga kamogawensis]
MLKNLLIKNYALIEHTEINPDKGLNIITGETGAGKSIMLGALGLLKGGRADTKALFDQKAKCVIEGSFDISSYKMESIFIDLELDYENVTLLRREITPRGKSRAFINDTPVRLDVMRKISERLMDIHSQHDTMQLGSNIYQLNLVDTYGKLEGKVEHVFVAYKQYKKTAQAYKQLLDEYHQVKEEFEFNQFQLKELDDANLDDIDQDELEKELEKLENAENIKVALNTVLDALSRSDYSTDSTIYSAITDVNNLADYSKSLSDIRERLDSCHIELRDIISEIESEEDNLFFDQERIFMIKETLDQLYGLQQKHRVNDLQELIEKRDSIREKVEKVESFDEALLEAETEKKAAYEAMLEISEILSKARQKVITPLAEQLNATLSDLGMPNGHLVIDQRETDPTASGMDEVEILFTANKGRSPLPLRDVASGGEFSRLMLAIKYILASKTALPTIIFDEIDTGISGEIAIKVGHIMEEMGNNHQVFTISHLPQIAALGSKHYYVYKDHEGTSTVSKIKTLDHSERVTEIAQMIGGSNPSEGAYQSAKELIG